MCVCFELLGKARRKTELGTKDTNALIPKRVSEFRQNSVSMYFENPTENKNSH